MCIGRSPFSSVVILIIDKYCVLSFEREREPPIPIHAYGPVTSEFATQGMKLPPRNLHLSRFSRNVQNGELVAKLGGMGRLDSGFRAGEEKLLDSFMPKRTNHFIVIVACNATLHN
jgi:hypothetical protein